MCPWCSSSLGLFQGIICDALRDLVPFVQFKKREKYPWRSVTFSTKSNTPWVFSRFLNCTNGTKSRKTSHICNIERLKRGDLGAMSYLEGLIWNGVLEPSSYQAASKKLEPWFVLWSLFLQRLLCISKAIILPFLEYCCHARADARNCRLDLLDKLLKRIFRTIGPTSYFSGTLGSFAKCGKAEACSFILKVTLLHRCFSRFWIVQMVLNCAKRLKQTWQLEIYPCFTSHTRKMSL